MKIDEPKRKRYGRIWTRIPRPPSLLPIGGFFLFLSPLCLVITKNRVHKTGHKCLCGVILKYFRSMENDILSSHIYDTIYSLN